MKYCIRFENQNLPIAEEEIEKVVTAMNEKKIVVLKCGILHGSYIRGIVRDINGERGINYNYHDEKLMRDDFKTDLPEYVKKLTKSLSVVS